MSEGLQNYTPKQARVILTGFVERADGTPVVEEYQELQEIVDAEIGLALTSLIMQTGRPPKHDSESNLAVLENKNRFSMVRGVIGTRIGTREPRTVQLSSYRRHPVRFRRMGWAHMDIDGVGRNSTAGDGEHFYMPHCVSEEFISFFMDGVGIGQFKDLARGSQTGLEIAGEATRESADTLSGYLRVAAGLTKRLLEVDVAA